MKSENLDKIKDLLIKYEAGKTSLEEEKSLIAFFNSKDVPLELADYHAEFNYYATFRNINFSGTINEPIKGSQNTIFEKIGKFFSKWFILIVIVVLPVILFVLFQPERITKEEINISDQKHEDHLTLLNIDSTEKEKTISQLNNTQASENKSHPVTSDNTLLQKKDAETTSNLQLQASDSIIQDTTSLRKGDEVIISEPYIDKAPAQDLNAIENTSINKPQDIQKANLNDLAPALEKVVFDITEATTTGELAAIARKAKQAGIEYTYVVDQHKKKTHELNIVMIIRSTGERSQFWISYPKKSSFSETICWSVDKNGQAMALCPGKIEHKVKAKHPIK